MHVNHLFLFCEINMSSVILKHFIDMVKIIVNKEILQNILICINVIQTKIINKM